MGLETPAPLASHQASEPVTEDSAEETQRLLKTLVEFTEATSEHVPNLGRAEWVRLRGLLAIPALFMLIIGLAFTMSTVHYDKQVRVVWVCQFLQTTTHRWHLRRILVISVIPRIAIMDNLTEFWPLLQSTDA